MKRWAAIVVVGACTGSSVALDAAHVPAEVRGMVPGVSGEKEALAAFPDARVDRDRSLGGDRDVRRNGRPAVHLGAEGYDVWLVRDGGELRVVSVRARLARACAAAIGDRAKEGACAASNRRLGRGEHEYCAGAIAIRCVDGESIGLRLDDGGGVDEYLGPIDFQF